MKMTFDHERLVAWFESKKRSLPWREHPDPYAVWISEVMLQQTQVAVVIPYFLRWMSQFPTIEALASADEASVIKAWEGLGYYARARNLHKGAKQVLEHFSGKLPDDEKSLFSIKGLGHYTVGAIRSFAFHQRTAAVDGNVLRVLTRYYNLDDDISKPKTVAEIRSLAEEILPCKKHWVFNEALIELGATVCMRSPKCTKCPVKKTCRGFLQGTAQELPVKTKKTQVTALYRNVVIITAEKSVLLRAGKPGALMHGLYEFPYFETSKEGMPVEELRERVARTFGLQTELKTFLKEEKHSFTRYRAQLFPVHLACKKPLEVNGYRWHPFHEAIDLPFSSGHRRIINQIQEQVITNSWG